MGLRLRTGFYYNIGSLTSRFIELEDIMKMKKVNILCLYEAKWVWNMTKIIVGERQKN